MQNQYEKVPNIITGKDLDYLSDMFNWNYGAFKKCSDSVSKIETLELKEAIQKAVDLFYKNINTTLEILSQGGNNE